MHTIRIKELKGKSWEQTGEESYQHKEAAEIKFFDYVYDFSEDGVKGISITWSQGKKVLGVYRVS